MCDRVGVLVEGSEAREHLYQIAGDIIQGFPDNLSSAEKALDRTSYALSVMGQDFLRGRIPFDDKDRVDGALVTSPFSGSRAKESGPERVAQRFLQTGPARVAGRYLQAPVAPSAESYFFHNPENREVREFNRSEAISNNPSVAVEAVKDYESPDRSVSKARGEARKAPPTPSEIQREPGGAEFSTLNRYLIQTDQPGVTGVPTHRNEIPKHPKPGK